MEMSVNCSVGDLKALCKENGIAPKELFDDSELLECARNMPVDAVFCYDELVSWAEENGFKK